MQNSCVVYTCNRSAGYSMHTENVHVVHSVHTRLKKLNLQNELHVSLDFANSLFLWECCILLLKIILLVCFIKAIISLSDYGAVTLLSEVI